MVWRDRVGIHDDLSRLHRSARTGAMSRELGYSSITQGEGSLELRATDSPGDVRARLGDQPDGRFGVGLWHRGGMQYLPDVLTDAEDRITATEVKNETQDHRLDAITTLAESNRGRLDAVEAKNETQDHRLDAVTDLAETNRGRLNGHDSTLASHDGRISTAQSRADSAYSRAGTALGDAASAMSRANDAYSLASGKASTGSVSTLEDKLDSRVAQLTAAIKKVAQNTNTPDPFL